jgi:hypothetical protein
MILERRAVLRMFGVALAGVSGFGSTPWLSKGSFVRVDFINGPRRVWIPSNRGTGRARAQFGGYDPALAWLIWMEQERQRQLAQMQVEAALVQIVQAALMQESWATQTQRVAMAQELQVARNWSNCGCGLQSVTFTDPEPWRHARSIYARGMVDGREATLIGVNRQSEHVQIVDTVPALQAIGGALRKSGATRKEIERSTGPQSDERSLTLVVDGREYLDARGYKTTNGYLAASSDETLDAEGERGHVGSFTDDRGVQRKAWLT